MARAGRISSHYPPYVGMLDKLRNAKDKFDRIKKIIKEAKQQWKRKKPQSAISKLDKVLTIDPGHKEAGRLKREWEKILRDQEKAKKIALEKARKAVEAKRLAEEEARKVAEAKRFAEEEARERAEQKPVYCDVGKSGFIYNPDMDYYV